MTGDDAGLGRFNGLAPDEAASQLRACCAADVWVHAVSDGRPYGDRAELMELASRELAALDWADVRQGIDAHPRIGERVSGAEREAAWSRREQSGMDTATDDVRSALVAANLAYEQRFGHVFLIFATGRTDTEMLAAARERLDHDDATERGVVRDQLGRIVALRLERLLDS